MAFSPGQLAPPAFNDPWVESDGRLTAENISWFMQILFPALQQAPSQSGSTPAFDESAVAASIVSTSLPLGTISTGTYRVTVYMRVTQADGVSSSVYPVLNFTDEAIACEVDGSVDPLTSDNIGFPKSWTFLLAVDQPGPIDFSTVYSSNTPGLMQYRVLVLVERMT